MTDRCLVPLLPRAALIRPQKAPTLFLFYLHTYTTTRGNSQTQGGRGPRRQGSPLVRRQRAPPHRSAAYLPTYNPTRVTPPRQRNASSATQLQCQRVPYSQRNATCRARRQNPYSRGSTASGWAELMGGEAEEAWRPPAGGEEADRPRSSHAKDGRSGSSRKAKSEAGARSKGGSRPPRALEWQQ